MAEIEAGRYDVACVLGVEMQRNIAKWVVEIHERDTTPHLLKGRGELAGHDGRADTPLRTHHRDHTAC